MATVYGCAKSIGLIFMVVGLTIVVSGAYINAYALPGFGPNIPAYDFTLTASSTLIKIQPGSSGALVIWVNPFCPGSTVLVVPQCDPTLISVVNLQVSGCAPGAFCILDRTQVLVTPLYSAESNFVMYSFSFTPTGVATITVTGTDQFGQSHVTQFGVIACYC